MKKLLKFAQKILHISKTIAALRISLHASSAGFFIVLSVFPALVLILSLLRYTGLEVDALLDVLAPILPEALQGTAENLIVSTYESSSRMVVGLSALTTLWSASRGVYGLLTGLNAVYGVTERRGYLRTRLISMVYTLSFLLVLMLTLILHVFGSTLLHLLPQERNPFVQFLTEAIGFRFFLLLIVQTVFFCVVYMVLPDKRSSFWDSVPGALLSSIGWLTFSDLFSVYVVYFPRYSNIFGSVYAVALSMLWLYCCLSIVFYGGALNKYLAIQRK